MKNLLIMALLSLTTNAFAGDCASIVIAQTEAGVTCNLENQNIEHLHANASNPMSPDDKKFLLLLLQKFRQCASKAVEVCETALNSPD